MLLLAELPVMLKLVHWGLTFQKLTGDMQNLTWAYRRDPELGFRRRPYDHWEGRMSSDIEFQWMMPLSLRETLVFTYDRWGYRNTAAMEQADVALIGDSYVEGWYVSDTETTAQRLRTRLGRPVVNLGVAGYGTKQELLVLKNDAIRFNPKVVIWFFFEGNDLYDDHRFENTLLAEPFTLEETTVTPEGVARDQGWTQRSFTLAVLRRLRRLIDPILPNNSPYFGHLATPSQDEYTVYFANYASKPWSDYETGRWKKARDTLGQVAEFARSNDIRVLFSFVPIKFRVYQPFVNFAPDSPCKTWDVWPIIDMFTKFCKTQKVPCLDLTRFFQDSLRNGGMPYSPVDSHWSPEGHELVAQLLEKEIHQRGWMSNTPAAP
jgi:hypothetical protein